MKKINTKVFLLTLILILITSYTFASADPLEEFESKFETNWDTVWGVLGPILVFVGIVVAILGVLILLFGIYKAGKWTIEMLIGRKKFGKEEIKTLAIAIIVGLLLTGGGWFGVVRFINKTIVKPAEEIIDTSVIPYYNDIV